VLYLAGYVVEVHLLVFTAVLMSWVGLAARKWRAIPPVRHG
jgi:hypothetical protein